MTSREITDNLTEEMLKEKPEEISLPAQRVKKEIYAGFLAGFVAAALAIMAGFFFHLFNVVTFSELISDRLAGIVPPALFEFMVQNIGSLAKKMLFYSLIAGQLGLGGLIGIVWARLHHTTRTLANTWRDALLGGLALFLLGEMIVLPLTQQGFLGRQLHEDPLLFACLALAGSLIFSLTLGGLWLFLFSRQNQAKEEIKVETVPETGRLGRRVFLGGGLSLFALATAGGLERLWAFNRLSNIGNSGAAGISLNTVIDQQVNAPLVLDTAPDLAGAPVAIFRPAVTPLSSFYHVSKNALDPIVSLNNWKLEIGGDVQNPRSYTYSELQQFPAVSQDAVLTCISNTVGGSLIASARWTGVRLSELLSRATPGTGAQRIVFSCADGYTDSILFSKGMAVETIVAYAMNGKPIPDDHGFPVRMIVPDIYGMKNVKWLQSIKVNDGDYQGFWEAQGWDNKATVQANSMIDGPAEGDTLLVNKPFTTSGIAFAGMRGVKKVELSYDNGKNWESAKIGNTVGPYSWSYWTHSHIPLAAGPLSIAVRVTDGEGKVQAAQERSSYPSGASGYTKITVKVT